MTNSLFSPAQLSALEALVKHYGSEWPWRSPMEVVEARLGRELTKEEKRTHPRNAGRTLEFLTNAGLMEKRAFHGMPFYRATRLGRDRLYEFQAERFGRVAADRIHVPGLDPEPSHNVTLTDKDGIKWARENTGWYPTRGDTDLCLKWSSEAMRHAGPFSGPRRRLRTTTGARKAGSARVAV